MNVILIAAISLDGFITKHDAQGSGFTSPEDKRYYRNAVRDFDSFIFGSKNFLLSRDWIRGQLRSDQRKVVMTRNPERLQDEAVPGEIDILSAPPAEVVRHLETQGFRNAALLGGGQIYGLFLEAGVVDELWITLEPLLFGDGIKLAETRLDIRAELLSCQSLGPSTLLLKYRPISS